MIRLRAAMLLAIGLTAGGVRADDVTQALRVSPDGHFLAQPDGEPFFWLGDTAWELFQRLDRTEVEEYLRDRSRKGFTVIQAVVGGVHDEPNLQGEAAFIGKDPTQPNERYFANVDWIVDRAAHYRLRIAMVPAWGLKILGGFTGDQARIFDERNAAVFGQWIAARYRNKGVIWILGGDSNPLWPKAIKMIKDDRGGGRLDRQHSDFTIVDYTPVYEALAKGIVAGEGGRPLITFHPSCCSFPGTPKPLDSLYFAHRSWLAMNMIQSSHYANPPDIVHGPMVGFDFGWIAPRNYEPIAAEYRSVPVRPVIDGEARFEDLGKDNDAPQVDVKGYWSGYDARNAAYHAVFAGAAGHTYGNHSIWQFYDPARNTPDPPARLDLPWRQALQRPVTAQLQYLRFLMLSRPYFTRIPDQSLIVAGQGEGADHVGATRDQGGRYAMIYIPHGRKVTVDLAKLGAPRLVGWWFDPDTGNAQRISSRFPASGAKAFTPPTGGPESDWVLVIDDEKAGFGPPGAELRQR